MKSTVFTIALLMVLVSQPAVAEPVANSGTIKHVIVYHGQALVTRSIVLETPMNEDTELLIENLPERIIPDSIYAQGGGLIEVLSVRYREKTITEDNRKEVKELEEQIYDIDRQMRNNNRDIENSIDRIDRYREQWKFVADTSKNEMNTGVLNTKTIIELNEFMAAKNNEIHKEVISLENKNLDLEKQKAELVQQLEKLKNAQQKTFREALVYLHIPQLNSANVVSLSYLVSGADWSPQYNLKAYPDEKQVGIEYNAVVHQASGEDWTNAVLALGTAVPALVASPAQLEPMKIGLVSAETKYRSIRSDAKKPMEQAAPALDQAGGTSVAYSLADQTEQFGRLVRDRRSKISMGIQAQQSLNSIAISNQMIEFEADKRLLAELKEKSVAIRRTEGVSVMYTLPGKLTLPSKSDQQLVTIASLKTTAEFVFVATPLLTDYVYLQADITNCSDTILLPGPADMFRNGQFVGKGDMKLVTIGQAFTTGFGVDSQIQVTREFKDKKTETLWGNRVDENHYRLAIENYYDKPIALRLFDRLPWTENPQLVITLTGNSHPLSADAEYLRTEKDKGILRWDLALEPNSTGDKAATVTYVYTMKYDNAMSITAQGRP